MNQNWRTIPDLTLIATVTGILFAGSSAIAQDRPANIKKFSDGPLTPSDFHATPPVSKLDAVTFTNTRYDFRYKFDTRGSVTTARITEINVFAVVERNKSWNTQKDNKVLLDHEQGHFDITHAFAMKVKIEMLKQIKARRPLNSQGRDEQDAVRKLNDKVAEFIELVSAETMRAHGEYDRTTRHGLSPETQQKQRQEQKKAIDLLADELKRIESD